MDLHFSFITFFISTIGAGYFYYGKRQVDYYFMLTGIALMVYPYFVEDIVVSTVVGILMLIFPFFGKRYL